MLRSKDGNENSYNASDAVNNIRWDELTKDSAAYEMMQYYQALISLRKDKDYLRSAEVGCELLSGNLIKATWTEEGKVIAAAWFNPNEEEAGYALEGSWNGVFGTDKQGAVGPQTLAEKSAVLWEAAE